VRRLAAIALLALLAAPAAGADEPESPRPGAVIERFLLELKAVERACGESPGISGYQAEPSCAHFEGDLRSFRRALRDACPGGLKSTKSVILEQRRSPDDSLFAAKLLVESHLLLDLFFEPSSGRVLVVQPPSCLELPPGRVPDFLEERKESDDGREVVDKIHPNFPERARQNAVGGLVVLDYVIETDGSVSQVCVVHVDPEGMAFELEAQTALKRWLYSPAPTGADPAGREARMVTSFWLQ
jgi:hypothetical protein